MSLPERIEEDLRQALKSGDTEKVSTLRLLKSELKNSEIKGGRPLKDEEVEAVIARSIKRRRESIDSFRTGEREDLATAEERGLATLQGYLPEPLTEAELVILIDRKLAEFGSSQPGPIIGAVKAEAGSRAEGGRIAELVTERLKARSGG